MFDLSHFLSSHAPLAGRAASSVTPIQSGDEPGTLSPFRRSRLDRAVSELPEGLPFKAIDDDAWKAAAWPSQDDDFPRAAYIAIVAFLGVGIGLVLGYSLRVLVENLTGV